MNRLYPAALFGLIALAVCWPTIVGGESWIPSDYYTNLPLFGGPTEGPVTLKNYRQYDIIEHNFAHDALIRRAFEQGEFPLWNPYHCFGLPLHAQPGPATLYPGKLLFNWPFDADRAYSWLLFTHLWLAGIAMYALCRRLGLVPMAAILGGVIWMMCGKTAVVFKYSNILPHLAWLPLVFAACVNVTWRSALWGSLALAMAMYGGHPYFQFASAVLLWIYMIAHRRGNVARYAVLVVAAVLMFLPQLVPNIQVIRDSPRVGFHWPRLDPDFQNWLALLTMVSPRILGGPVDRADLYTEYRIVNPVELQFYVGLVPLALGIVGLATWRRNAIRFFWIGALAIFALILVRPANALVHAIIPGFSELNLYRLSYLFAFCAAVAAAAAFDRMLKDREAFLRLARIVGRIAGAAFALGMVASVALLLFDNAPARWLNIKNGHVHLALAFLAGVWGLIRLFRRDRLHWFAASAVALTVVELWVFFRAFNPTYPFAIPPAPPEVRRLQTETWQARVYYRARLEWFGTRHPNLLSHYGIRVPGGYENFFSHRYYRWASGFGATITPTGASAVEFQHGYELANMGINPSSLDLFESDNRRAVLYCANEIAVDEESAYRALMKNFWGVRVVEATSSIPTGDFEERGTIQSFKEGFNVVELDIEARSEAVLFLYDSFHPDWECAIDGTPTTIYRANYLMRAVVVPAGTHRVVFRYVPRLFYGCVVVAGVTLAAVTAALAVLARRGTA